MKPPKALCWMVLVVTLPQIAGCTSLRPVYRQSIPNSRGEADQSRVLTVITTDSASVDLNGVWMDSLAVRGTVAGGWQTEQPVVELLREDIARIEETRFDGVKTTLLVLGLAGTVVVVLYAVTVIAFVDALEDIGK